MGSEVGDGFDGHGCGMLRVWIEYTIGSQRFAHRFFIGTVVSVEVGPDGIAM